VKFIREVSAHVPVGLSSGDAVRECQSSTPGAGPRPRRTLQDHLDPSVVPKRILALDGGGVRGILTLQYLKRIETILRDRRGDTHFLLADYFDLIGGTSTGAIIAGGLARGFSVDHLIERYHNLAAKVFRKPWFRIGAMVPKFNAGAIRELLKETYGANIMLGSDEVRASTAAPHYFKPEDLEVGRWLDPSTGSSVIDRGQFVDGGVSTANNPSLQLLKVALLKGFSFNWQAGEDCMLLVSVGTGRQDRKHGRAHGIGATAGAFALRALLSLMDDCNDEVQTLMQWLSSSPTRWRIDGQIEGLENDSLAGRPLLSYRRYDVIFSRDWFKMELGLDKDQAELQKLVPMDQPGNMDALAELGAEAARLQIAEDHLPPAFDPV